MNTIFTPVRVIDDRVNLRSTREYGVRDCGRQISSNTFQANSVSNSQIVVSCNPPDRASIVSPMVYAEVQWELKVQWTKVGGGNWTRAPIPAFQLGAGQDPSDAAYGNVSRSNDCPRAWPFHSSCSSISVNNNGYTVTSQPTNYIDALQRCSWTDRMEDREFSGSPTMPDTYGDYVVASNKNNDPFAGIGDDSTQAPRGAYQLDEVILNEETDNTNNTPVNGTLRFTVFEPVIAPPFFESKSGFMWIQNSTWTFTFVGGDQLAAKIWSSRNILGRNNAGNTAREGTAVYNASILKLALHFQYIKPKQSIESLPMRITSQYSEILHQAKALTLPNNPLLYHDKITETLNLNNIQNINRRFLIYMRKTRSTSTIRDADSFFRPEQLTIQWGTDQGKLSTMNSRDLYNMSVENGLQMSWNQWYYTSGGPVIVDTAKDLGLSEDLAPGVNENPLVSITLSGTNLIKPIQYQNEAVTSAELCCDIVFEGAYIIDKNGAINFGCGYLSKNDVRAAMMNGSIPVVQQSKPTDPFGGSFWSGLQSAARGIYDTLSPYYGDISNIVKRFVGRGAPEKEDSKQLSNSRQQLMLQAPPQPSVDYSQYQKRIEEIDEDDDLEQQITPPSKKRHLVRGEELRGGSNLSSTAASNPSASRSGRDLLRSALQQQRGF